MENMPNHKLEMHTLLLCTEVPFLGHFVQCSEPVARHAQIGQYLGGGPGDDPDERV